MVVVLLPELLHFLPRLGRIPNSQGLNLEFFFLRAPRIEFSPARIKTLFLLSFKNSELFKEFCSLCTPCSYALCVKALALLSLTFSETLRGFHDSCTPCRVSARMKVLSVLSFILAQTSKELSPSSSPADGEFGCPPGYPSAQATFC
jgi:hypothetical protein